MTTGTITFWVLVIGLGLIALGPVIAQTVRVWRRRKRASRQVLAIGKPVEFIGPDDRLLRLVPTEFTWTDNGETHVHLQDEKSYRDQRRWVP